MGPKPAKAGGPEGPEGEDPLQFLQNYKKYCTLLSMDVHKQVVRVLSDEEKFPITQVVIDNEFGPLGAGGTRALMTALLGSGQGMRGGPYKLLKSVRLWRSNVGCEGAAAIAEVLRLGGGEVKINFLELLDCEVGPMGGLALGRALAMGANLSLHTLKMDYNATLGTVGAVHLCTGIRTNCTLKYVCLKACRIGKDAGVYIGDVLSFNKSNITEFDVSCNKLGGKGLQDLCNGLMQNTKLEKINLSDNAVEMSDEDEEGLAALRDVLLCPSVNLTSVDMSCNRFGERGATVLVPALTEENIKIKEFLVDLTLPMHVFEQIFRKRGKKGKKGKKKGKKKK